MPEDKEPKTVDIDTSGPGADVELPEEKVTETVETVEPEKQVEEKVEEKQETSDDKQETKVEEKQETKEEEKPKEELEQYSEGVQKRIAKLSTKWREADRQKEAALDYASKLISLKKSVEKNIFVIMRVYFEKPRTVLGWKGLINDPDLDNSFKITKGLKIAI